MASQIGSAMSDINPVEFDLGLEEISVTLKNNGSVQDCVLREMDGYKRDQYLNSQKNKLQPNSNNLKDFVDVQSSLIAQCLFDKNTNEAVPIKDIRNFPSKVQTRLYEMCMTLCGFDQKAEETAKNS